jgi:hypothetical protein
MPARSPTSSSSTPVASEDLQAFALWSFVHLKVPPFTARAAQEVLRGLNVPPGEDPKHLAKRLRRALAARGVTLKHTAALQAAARLLGHSDWHSAQRTAAKAELALYVLGRSGDEIFAGWRDAAPRICQLLEERRLGANVVEIRFSGDQVMFGFPRPREREAGPRTESMPLIFMRATQPDERWLADAPFAFETIRRYFEESGKAVVDGAAVVRLCSRRARDANVTNPDATHAVEQARNSELVLWRQDDDTAEPGSGYEIARGDEMTCWSQLDMALQEEAGENGPGSLDDSAWRFGDGRYVWRLETLQPGEFKPELTITVLSQDESTRLYRRYRLAQRLCAGSVRYHESLKWLDYLSRPNDLYHVEPARVHDALQKSSLTWVSFCEAEGLDEALTDALPTGVLMTLLERTKPEQPNALFTSPPRAVLERVTDGALVRALMPRVAFVRYRMAPTLDVATRVEVREALDNFGTSLRMLRMPPAFTGPEGESARLHLAYANDAEELRLRLEGLGLVAYAGVVPHFVATEEFVPKSVEVPSYAFGHAIFLDIDLAPETVQ